MEAKSAKQLRAGETIRVVADITPGDNRRIIARIRDHEVIMDVRKERGGDDTAPSPPEYLAVSLGGCIMNLIRLMAREKKIMLRDLRVTIDGLIDPSRAMGIASENRAGFQEINADIAMQTDLPADDRDRFIDELNQRCVLCDTLVNETPLRCRFAIQQGDASTDGG